MTNSIVLTPVDRSVIFNNQQSNICIPQQYTSVVTEIPLNIISTNIVMDTDVQKSSNINYSQNNPKL